MHTQATQIKEFFDRDRMELVDIYRAKLPVEYQDLDKADKKTLIGEFESGSRTLVVTLPISASDRMINRRIYPQKGMKSGLSTWLKPFPKPVLMHHNDWNDPIGRVAKTWFEPRDYLSDFKNIAKYNDFKKRVESDEPAEIFAALLDHKKLLNPKWQGTGRLMADVEITDTTAIEKFIDGRYLTVSSGHISDRWVCSNCNSNWMQDEMCEHYPGRIIEGIPVVHILGKFIGREVSVVNKPANDISYVQNMRFTDSAEIPEMFTENETLVNELIDFDEEIKMGIKLKVPEGEVTEPLIEATLEATSVIDVDALIRNLVDKMTTVLDERFAELKDAMQPEVIVEDTKQDEEFVDDESIDWALLDIALDAEVGEKLTDEKRAELPDSAFCGPDRSFPISDATYSEAAQTLIPKTKLSDEQKQRLLACVSRKIKASDNDRLAEVERQLADMTENYRSALERIENIQKLLDNNPTVVQNDDNVDIDPVDDPQVTGTQDGADDDKLKLLGKFERGIVSKYRELKDDSAEDAESYLATQKRSGFLPMSFDPNSYL